MCTNLFSLTDRNSCLMGNLYDFNLHGIMDYYNIIQKLII